MSNGSSFREKLARRAETSDGVRSRSSSLVEVRIALTPEFSGPVQLARILHEHGFALAEAHAAVSRLANEHSIEVCVASDDLDEAMRRFRVLGLAAETLHDSFS